MLNYFFFILKKIENICFPDNNIHYIFNSYNNRGIWKSFDIQLYEYCFYFEYSKNKKEYENVLNNDFDLEKYMKNITSVILNNLADIKELIKNNDYNKEYIEQILIMLPSCFFLKVECVNIIKKCVYLCENLE